MRVYFIGAGPGAADLITLRGVRILNNTLMVMYAGSLVPAEILTHCHKDATLINTASLSLPQQIDLFKEARDKDINVARLHSGDPAIYGAINEQMNQLQDLGIAFEIVPGVSSFTAAAASINCELTKPNVSQSIILTRVSGRASKIKEKESLENLAKHQATMCIFLSGAHLPNIIPILLKNYASDTPIALVYKASTSEERKHISTLENVLNEINVANWVLTTMLLVGDVLRTDLNFNSCLYSINYSHKYRKAKGKSSE